MFEIGDKVIYQGADKAAYRREGTVVSIEDKDGKPQLTVELDGGETFTAPIDDWSRKFNNACTSTNSVVRNAMAAHGVARNATGYVNITSELNLIKDACIKAERAMELEGARISLKPIMDAYRKVRAQVGDWWEDKKRREAL